MRGQGHTFAQVAHPPGHDQCGGGIQQHSIAIGARRALQDSFQRRGVERGVAALDRLDRRARQAGILRFHDEAGDLAALQRRHVVLSGDGQFIEAHAMHDPGRLVPERGERLRHRPRPVGENTPVNCRRTRAGLASGPSRLKIVRVPSSTRGPAACRIDG